MPLNFKKKEKKKYVALLQRHWPWLSLGIFVLLIFILLAPYVFRPWTKYPDELKADIAWRQFQATFNSSCRESCLASRQTYADIWRPYFKRRAEVAAVQYELAFRDGKEDLQSALIKIMAADYGRASLPPVLAEFIAQPDASGEIKRQIVISFPEAFADEDWLRNLRLVVTDERAASEERVYALKLLFAYPDAASSGLVKEILMRDNMGSLTSVALQVASSWPENTIRFATDDLITLEHLIYAENDKAIRWQRLWYLVEAANGKDEILRGLLSNIAKNAQLDVITRGLAADTLRVKFEIEIMTPEPTSADWQEYYEKI